MLACDSTMIPFSLAEPASKVQADKCWLVKAQHDDASYATSTEHKPRFSVLAYV